MNRFDSGISLLNQITPENRQLLARYSTTLNPQPVADSSVVKLMPLDDIPSLEQMQSVWRSIQLLDTDIANNAVIDFISKLDSYTKMCDDMNSYVEQKRSSVTYVRNMIVETIKTKETTIKFRVKNIGKIIDNIDYALGQTDQKTGITEIMVVLKSIPIANINTLSEKTREIVIHSVSKTGQSERIMVSFKTDDIDADNVINGRASKYVR